MKTKFIAFTVLLLPCLCFSAVTYHYDLNSEFASGNSLNSDGWSSSGTTWTAASFLGQLYARNNTGTDARITRVNDANFSVSIPTNTTRLQLTITARSGSNFWQAGLASSSGDVLGIGADFSQDNRIFILDGGVRRAETLGSETAFGDAYDTLMIDFDLVTGRADLIRNPGGTNTVLRSNVSMTGNVSQLAAVDRLFIRSIDEFVGPSSIRVTVIPEPSVVLLSMLGVVLILFRRHR